MIAIICIITYILIVITTIIVVKFYNRRKFNRMTKDEKSDFNKNLIEYSIIFPLILLYLTIDSILMIGKYVFKLFHKKHGK